MSGAIEPILMTGASGFVGRHVTQLLRSRGVPVVAHARRAARGINWLADLTDPQTFLNLVRFDVAAMIHCAATIPTRSDEFDRDNTRASATLAESLSNAKSLKRVIHVSSVAVYQRSAVDQWVIHQNARTLHRDGREGFYATSKLAAERSLDAVGQSKPGVAVTYLRISSIYGSGICTRLGSSSPIIDKGYKAERPEPVFLNRIAKRLNPSFRSLADHLAEAS